MPQPSRIIISPRDEALLKLLARTPVTKQLVLQASRTFSEPFADERRVRERLQTLTEAGLVKVFNASAVGGLLNYYKLTPDGFRLAQSNDSTLPPRAFFSEIAPSRFMHTLTVAEVIVQVIVSAHEYRIQIERFHREHELVFEAVGQTLIPDCQFSLSLAGRWFHLLFEIDNSTESLDSFSYQSIKNKLLGYDTYQDGVLAGWAQAGRNELRPAFRVVFLTKTAERAEHILSLAYELARNRDRRLFVAATQDVFLAERDALRAPILLDHFGCWHALVDLHPTAVSTKSSVRLRQVMAQKSIV